MLTVEFDPVAHAYRVDGQPVASVTQALARAGYITAGDFYTEAGRRLGIQLHEVTERIDRRLRISDAMIVGIEGEVAAYRRFLNVNKPRYAAIEAMLAKRGIAGRADRIVRQWQGRPLTGVLELKRGSCAEWHGYQTAGYAFLCEQPITHRWCLHLRPDGTYRLMPHSSPMDRYKFLDAIYQERNRVRIFSRTGVFATNA